MVRGSNNLPQNSYTATDQEKLTKKGVWSSFYSDNKCAENILSFQPIGERVHILRIKKNLRNIRFINIHAPTEDKQEEKDKL
jgi:hypothetical protein